MSPDMLTLVAAVLAYDLAYDSALDICEALDGCELLSSGLRSRNVRSETKEEKDMFSGTISSGRVYRVFVFASYIKKVTQRTVGSCIQRIAEDSRTEVTIWVSSGGS